MVRRLINHVRHPGRRNALIRAMANLSDEDVSILGRLAYGEQRPRVRPHWEQGLRWVMPGRFR